MNKPLIDQAVDRFLGWKLPADFAPDAGISFKREVNAHMPPEYRYNSEPTGTNLFDADQAKAMLSHVAEPLLDRIKELESFELGADVEAREVDRLTARVKELEYKNKLLESIYSTDGREFVRLNARIAELEKDAARYQWLRRAIVELSLSNETIASLMRDQSELDSATSQEGV